MIDYHVHTRLCGHAEGEVIEYARQAAAIGLRQLGFADHMPLLTNDDPTLTMSPAQLDGYIESVERLKAELPQVEIRLGIEADYLPGREDDTARLLAAYPFDYVIGSIHFIDGWGFDDSRYIEGYQSRDIYELYEQYFGLVASAARSGLFDIIGHMDLVKKFDFKPDRDIAGLVDGAVGAIKDAGACIEINTAGIRKPVGEMYPSGTILARCFEAGIPITLGSDAHEPAQVGMDLDRAVAAARRAGYDRVAVFDKRTRGFIPLD